MLRICLGCGVKGEFGFWFQVAIGKPISLKPAFLARGSFEEGVQMGTNGPFEKHWENFTSKQGQYFTNTFNEVFRLTFQVG